MYQKKRGGLQGRIGVNKGRKAHNQLEGARWGGGGWALESSVLKKRSKTGTKKGRKGGGLIGDQHKDPCRRSKRKKDNDINPFSSRRNRKSRGVKKKGEGGSQERSRKRSGRRLEFHWDGGPYWPFKEIFHSTRMLKMVKIKGESHALCPHDRERGEEGWSCDVPVIVSGILKKGKQGGDQS